MTTSNPVAGGATMRLHRDDLIDDHELNDVGEDRLSHDGIADQLALIVRTVDAPANVALFGPWGSGKSGIGNLLKKKVHGVDGIRVARFDAYKYAELPLQRNFVSAVAAELGQTQSKYHDDLYNGRTKTDITVPAATIGKILGIFALLIFGLSIILLALVAAVAAFQKGGFRDDFESHIGTALKAGLVPAVLLSGLVALATKTFQVDRSIAKPESDEQFEKLFTELIADSKAKRLVVFVDELDRCSASEVVETLDTVRTFLGVAKCVFIIAADRHVLEEALTRAAKQETPANDDNPYYSTGSAYLDKVFQYQVSLPPLLTQNVSNFAATLVKGRGGLWADINTPYVLSVLVPTHVTSPRRVKHLINTFALTYRLSEQRHRSGLLAEDPKLNAPAIAKLACLRVEFPLFARHLEVDATLPSLVLELARDPKVTFGPGVTERARELAVAYALENAAPASMLDADLNSDDVQASTPADSSAGSSSPDDQVAEVEPHTPVRTHNKQLINYLSRTSRVNGLSRALVYQQTSGTVLGLDGEVAQAIESAAEDKDIAELRRLIESLDGEGQAAAFDLLAQHIRTGVGVAGPNTARSFLLLQQEMPDFVAGRAVDAICESIAHLYDDDSGLLDDETIASAWSLSKRGSDAGSSALRTLIVNDLADTDGWDGESPAFLLKDTLLALDADRKKATEYVVAHLAGDDGVEHVATLFEMPDNDLIRAFAEVGGPLSSKFQQQSNLHSRWKNKADAAAKTPATTARPTAAAPATGATADELGPEPFNPAPVLNSIATHASSRETPLQHRVIGFLLTIDSMHARNAALEVLQRTEAVEDSSLVGEILKTTQRRKVVDWSNWVTRIRADAVSTSDVEVLASLYEQVWDEYAAGDITAEVCRSALDALQPLRDMLADDVRPDLTEHAMSTINFIASAEAEAEVLMATLERIDLFECARLVESTAVATGIAKALQDTLAADGAPVTADDFLYRYVLERGIPALRTVPVDKTIIDGIVAEALGSSWLGEVQRVYIALLAAQATDGDPTDIANMPKSVEIADLVTQWGTTASSTATLWVHLMYPTPDDLAPIWEALRHEGGVTADFVGAVEEARELWAPSEREAFVRRYVRTLDDLPLTDAAVRVLGVAQLEDSHAASILTDLYGQTTNNAQRRQVVNLWEEAHISNDRVRRELFEAIIYNMLELNADGKNAQSADLALDALDRFGAPLPRNIKRALGAKVEAAVEDDQALNTKATRVLTGLGYRVTSSGFLGRKKRVDFTE